MGPINTDQAEYDHPEDEDYAGQVYDPYATEEYDAYVSDEYDPYGSYGMSESRRTWTVSTTTATTTSTTVDEGKETRPKNTTKIRECLRKCQIEDTILQTDQISALNSTSNLTIAPGNSNI